MASLGLSIALLITSAVINLSIQLRFILDKTSTVLTTLCDIFFSNHRFTYLSNRTPL